ncbi:class I adenylate-forming enzyme family protein [Oricola thermophila]|uniref:3-methylmercaptopropionyl-CoA ligase n=1 Tax=Oricola thermophila TaxID=2742145 RepID=A0A6N1VEK6_9HYPH|nr:class I adenylate-forming enzyme family protein [Oricola thermophila]QKV19118.1 acyl--CoA ligase [Oricola thermophila]
MIRSNLAECILLNSERRRERVALRDDNHAITFGELRSAVDGYAGFLQNLGVKRGEVVGLTMRDGVHHVIAMLSIIRLGAVLLPLDVRWTSEEKDNVARAFGASYVITDTPSSCVLTSASVIEFDMVTSGAGHEFTPPADFSPDEPLLMSLSSGTTGIPKGPRITHRQMFLRHYSEWMSLDFSPNDVFLCATPLYFGGGRGFTLSYLLGGATIVFCQPPYRPGDIEALVRRYGVTTTFLVPTLLRRIKDSAPDVLEAMRSLRFVICSGSALHPKERDELLRTVNSRIVNFYASTEGGGVSVLNADEGGTGAPSVGRPILGSDIRICDDRGNALAIGEIGHIRQSAPWHPDGFFNNPEETARYFRDGWYLPGDLGYVDDDGYLFITGRSKDIIIRGGVNIYPAEIEALLISHPDVSDAAVVPKPSEELGEQVVAFVVAGADRVSDQELADYCRASLAPYKIPSEIHFIDELPRNSGGKVIKADLGKRLAAMP